MKDKSPFKVVDGGKQEEIDENKRTKPLTKEEMEQKRQEDNKKVIRSLGPKTRRR